MAIRMSIFTDDKAGATERLQSAANDVIGKAEQSDGKYLDSHFTAVPFSGARTGGGMQYTLVLIYDDGEATGPMPGIA